MATNIPTLGQPARRRGTSFQDQHGRRWETVIEIASGAACAPFRPTFAAPLYPPQKYIKHIPGSAFEIRIDYEEWASESRDATNEWNTRLRDAAVKLGVQGTVQQLIDKPPAEILDLVGPPPSVTDPEVIAACEAENVWVLYYEGDMPDAAAPFFPELLEKATAPAEDDWRPPGATKDPWAAADEDQRDDVVPPGKYELEMHGAGWFKMPDGVRVRGTREVAMEKLKTSWPTHYKALLETAEATS